jgi:hypothetical protein
VTIDSPEGLRLFRFVCHNLATLFSPVDELFTELAARQIPHQA